ncbi:uncharacterized protein LOC133790539 [Humulus lupulus]|uniref:uncharacterized protein LOC133790539 n=1 Tax=Humulus lupulus TaxID=3486 RepID=UPI002B40D1D5|nr:uncharacterized protein LOC133790539 [Humulus lupulus]
MGDQSRTKTTDERDVMEKKKKVKTLSHDDHQREEDDCDYDDDEGKIDKFFELITSFREARNRLRNGVMLTSNTKNNNNNNKQETKNERNTKTKKRKQPNSSAAYDDEDNGGQTSWIPSFEREDFTSQLEFRGIPSIFPTSNTPNDQSHHRKPQLINGLNLNLSL